MNERGRKRLVELGELLHRDEYPHVGTDGRVMPEPDHPGNGPGEGAGDDVQREEGGSEGPEARQGQGTAAANTSAADPEALLIGQPGLTEEVRHDLGVAMSAYPSMRLRLVPPVVWLLTENTPITGLSDKAYVLTVVSMDARRFLAGRTTVAASWAWWDVGIRIGPRHTNYGDGSVCSFEPSQHTWTVGQPLVRLLDLHAVWVARHVFLRYLGSWPGDQTLHTAHERLAEHRPGELCGCGSFRPYEACHREADLVTPPYARMREFLRRFPDPSRRIPQEAWEHLCLLRHRRPWWSDL